jgi:hypothetical protein
LGVKKEGREPVTKKEHQTAIGLIDKKPVERAAYSGKDRDYLAIFKEKVYRNEAQSHHF